MSPAKQNRATDGPNFGDLNFYSGGRMMPEGNYAIEFTIGMHAGTKSDGTPAGPERLGVFLNATPITESGEANGDPLDPPHFISMGSKAHESWAPDPDTSKSLVAVPGGPGAGLSNKTNWFLFLKSIYDCGMPQGTLQNDLSAIDGIWVHVANVPEPEDRKNFRAQTGEAGGEERRGGGMVPVVTEILEGGKPWDGSGGMPSEGAKKPAAKGKAAPAAAPKTNGKAKAAPPAAADDSVREAASESITSILAENESGMKRTKLRMEVFKAVKKAHGDEMVQKVMDEVVGNDDALSGVLEELGFTLSGQDIKPQ